eukprot:COSAG02_NODE_506_length_20931_cov_20.533218_13_plen_344_part_00
MRWNAVVGTVAIAEAEDAAADGLRRVQREPGYRHGGDADRGAAAVSAASVAPIHRAIHRACDYVLTRDRKTPECCALPLRKMDLGFDSDDMEDTDGDTSSLLGSPDKSKASVVDDETQKLLELERAALMEAKDQLADSESKNRALQRKFDQLKSASTGQLSFMKKKLEAQYQNTVDGMEAELEESRDESQALRMQMQQLIEHMEASGAAPPAQLVAATENSGDSRHLEKLKKELVKKDETLRRYEQELESIRSSQILPAAAECAAAATGVQELKRQLEASQAEVDALRKSGNGGGGGDSSALQAEVARLTQELRVAKMQATSAAPAPAPAAATAAVSARALFL